MKALILAAGFGTRLYPLTLDIPKAMMEVNNKPIIEYIIQKIIEVEEIKEIYIITNNKFYINFLEWKNKFKLSNKKIKIKLIGNSINKNTDKKGAISDLQKALEIIGEEDLIILASDNFFEFSLKTLVEISKIKNKSFIPLRKEENIELIKKYACVKLNKDNKVIYFKEKPIKPQYNLCSVGCYVLTKEDIIKIKNHKFENLDNMGNIIEFLHKVSEIYGKSFNEFWTDIGSIEELKKLRKLKQ